MLECTFISFWKISAHHLRNAYTFENTFEGTTSRITTPGIPPSIYIKYKKTDHGTQLIPNPKCPDPSNN